MHALLPYSPVQDSAEDKKTAGIALDEGHLVIRTQPIHLTESKHKVGEGSHIQSLHEVTHVRGKCPISASVQELLELIWMFSTKVIDEYIIGGVLEL